MSDRPDQAGAASNSLSRTSRTTIRSSAAFTRCVCASRFQSGFGRGQPFLQFPDQPGAPGRGDQVDLRAPVAVRRSVSPSRLR